MEVLAIKIHSYLNEVATHTQCTKLDSPKLPHTIANLARNEILLSAMIDADQCIIFATITGGITHIMNVINLAPSPAANPVASVFVFGSIGL